MEHKSIAITDRSSVGEARRGAVTAAQSLGFDESRRSDIAIAATELSNNVLLHANGGELLICPTVTETASWIDLLALDSGPGITDIGRAMEDGFSSIGTAGQGLGAVQRVSDASSLYSSAGKGTVYWSRFSRGDAPPAGVLCISVRDEQVAGDSYLLHRDGHRFLYMMVDGLGHGHGAAEAAREAVLATRKLLSQAPSQILSAAHESLRHTRGAAMSLAVFDERTSVLTYSGVGNVSAMLLNGTNSRSLISRNGTVGAVMPRSVQDFTYDVDQGTMLVMFTDGLTSRTTPSVYPGFQRRPSMLLAGLLFRDFSRRRDDASVLVTPLGGGRL